MMIGTCFGAILDGIDSTVIRVEADVAQGLPQFSIVGLPDSAVSESKLRIRSAIKNSGFDFPNRRITVNLSPASMRKHGAGLDLAITIAILRACAQIPPRSETEIGFSAELGLSGTLEPVPAVVNLGLAYRRRGISIICVAQKQERDCISIPDARWLPVQSLRDVVNTLRTPHQPMPFLTNTHGPFVAGEDDKDWVEVRGVTDAKRALTIAAAGRHHILLVGPPGCGKTMLAERFPGILPRLSSLHATEVYAISQAAGLNSSPTTSPPFRNPHHSLTSPGMIGGGAPLFPGEATLAHRGVLLLDELLEFSRKTLDTLREPLMHKEVRLNRGGKIIALPADFLLVATCNPCPCGQRGFGECRCSDAMVTRYWSHLSGPLMDRIDISVYMQKDEKISTEQAESAQTGASAQDNETTTFVRSQVEAASRRLEENSMKQQGGAARQSIRLDTEASQLLEEMGRKLSLSRRGIESIGRVAATICALEGAGSISLSHVQEAAGLRNPGTRSSKAEHR